MYILFVSVLLMAVGNFIGAMTTSHPDRDLPVAYHANFAFTLSAGLIINLGTVLQIVGLLRARRSKKEPEIQHDYTVCLLMGCLLLVICQMYSYTLGHNANAEFLCTIATSLISLVCTFSFWLTNRYVVDHASVGDNNV